MKKFLIAVSVLMIAALTAMAQEDKTSHNHQKDNNWEEIKAEKVGLITTCLELSVEEAQRFWPLYNQYEKELGEANRSLRKATKGLKPKKGENLSEAEMTARVNAYISAKGHINEIAETYNKEFLKVLPAFKVARLYLAEEQFKHQILDRFTMNKARKHGSGGKEPAKPQSRPM